MGQEIADSHFTQEDFRQFAERLDRETRLLECWLMEGHFPSADHVGGFELEAWLIDDDAAPVAANDQLLAELADPLVVPELAQFNLELNGSPQPLRNNALSLLADELAETWSRCGRAAARNGARLAMIGILPTVSREHLTLDNMSSMKRYEALDRQLDRLRRGRPLHIDIQGKDHLEFTHRNVMLESATTSFQIHLKVDPKDAARFYNASKILSAPVVALSANSPFLFGAELWDETRIPLFEQSVLAGDEGFAKRVGFGRGYVDSIMDCFRANLDLYDILLPHISHEPEVKLPHLRLHNGTIWRWNRPLVGFNQKGEPHLRIEHRVVPAGPTVIDSIANAAFYFGAVYRLAHQPTPPEVQLPFQVAKNNFYRAARSGLEAELNWFGGRISTVREICESSLVPMAEEGLRRLGIDSHEIDYWLGIIRSRLKTGQTGAAWQRAWVRAHGKRLQDMTEHYLDHQQSGLLIHEWPL